MAAFAQEGAYLMPEFAQGMIYFKGQAPAQGMLNICAIDNSLRFLDDSGKEMIAASIDNVLKVRIDTALFMNCHNIFYRMYKVQGDMGVAVKRNVQPKNEGKQGAYGTTSQTASIREGGTFYADGVGYNLASTKEQQFIVNETMFLYKGDEVLVFNKKNLKRIFPDKKAALDEYFKSGGNIPETVPEATEFLKQWL